MKKWFSIFAASVALTFLASTANAQWVDNFDSYSIGDLAGQSDWEEWYSSFGVDMSVVTDHPFTGTKCVLGQADDDVVYPFALLPGGRPSSGEYLLTVRTFIPATATGNSFVIALNTYNDPAVGPDNWSLQVRFNANSGKVKNEGNLGGELIPMIKDAWIPLRVYINLDDDRVDMFYGDTILATNKSWKDGSSTGGVSRIDVLDLYGGNATGGTSGTYFDDTSLLDADGYAVVLNARPNPVKAKDVIALTTMAPQLLNSSAALFVWEVNGLPLIKLISVGSIDISGKWILSGPVPSGLAGIDIKFLSVALGPSGGTVKSNKELVQFR